MILLGSRALSLRAPQLLARKPLDFDFACTREEFDQWMEKNSYKVNPTKIYPEKNKMIVEGSTNCEFEIAGEQPSTQMLIDLVSQDPEAIDTPFGKVPSLDMLFTIKSSHKYLKNSPHFFKNFIDYHTMKAAGAQIRPEYQEWHSIREKETYNYSHPKLNVTKDNFFKDDAIEYKYDHDSIHESVKLYERPAYTYYLKDGEEVMTDMKKFFTVDHKYRIAGVIEESLTLSLERALVPHFDKWKSPMDAVRFAYSKVASSITSGKFREFAYMNGPEVLKVMSTRSHFYEKFLDDVKTGLVKPFTGSRY